MEGGEHPTGSIAAACSPRGIGELRERSLHAGLKSWYARAHDRIEVPLEGYVVDLVRRGTLIEIQTRSFGKLRRKLTRLLSTHRLRLVFPVAQRKWIVTTDEAGRVLRRRRSPKRGAYRDVFAELMRIPDVMGNSHFTLDDSWWSAELRCNDGRGKLAPQGRQRPELSRMRQSARRPAFAAGGPGPAGTGASEGAVHQPLAGRRRRHVGGRSRRDDLHPAAHGRPRRRRATRPRVPVRPHVTLFSGYRVLRRSMCRLKAMSLPATLTDKRIPGGSGRSKTRR